MSVRARKAISVLVDRSDVEPKSIEDSINRKWCEILEKFKYHYCSGMVHTSHIDRSVLMTAELGVDVSVMDDVWRTIDPLGGLSKLKEIMIAEANYRRRRWYNGATGLHRYIIKECQAIGEIV